MGKKATSYFIIGTFVTLYLLVSVISTIHVIDFFSLSNPVWLAVSLAVAFEVGAAASLASLITLEKMNRGIVWSLFIILTLMQAMGNTYYAYSHLHDYQNWIELFGLSEDDPIYQKRILSIVSGAILPIVALGFIKSLVDYIKPDGMAEIREEVETSQAEPVDQPAEKTEESLSQEIQSGQVEPIETSGQESEPEENPQPEPDDQSVKKTEVNKQEYLGLSLDSRIARGLGER